jgi:hypothetical protein
MIICRKGSVEYAVPDVGNERNGSACEDFEMQRRNASKRRSPADPARQIMAAGPVTSLVGALLVAALGSGTTALMLKAAWLGNWLDHGLPSRHGSGAGPGQDRLTVG